MKEAIDAVICWVDSNDPEHSKKINSYRDSHFENSVIPTDLAGDTRFRSVGEIFVCVASILRFAPFFRKIFIVTDQQNPNVDSFVNKYFPDRSTQIQIVDHKEIFRGYENYLPVFNSNSIETMIYRIPDLSEKFVYFNDDVLLLRETGPKDFFVGEKTCAYSVNFSIPALKFIRALRPRKGGNKAFGFKDGMLNSALTLGLKRKLIGIGHTPHPMFRSVLEEYFEEHPEKLVSNIKFRFRDSSMYIVTVLHNNIVRYFKDRAILKSYKKYLLTIKPKHSDSYIRKKIERFDKDENLKFLSVNSLDTLDIKYRKLIFDWLSSILNVKFDNN